MEPVRAIARLGFKRWYERELLRAHGWLVAALLLGLAFTLVLDDLFQRPVWQAIPETGVLFVGGLICLHAFTRFAALMARANRLAERSTCKGCGAYAAFGVIREYPRKAEVRCRRCSTEWLLD